MSFRCLSSFVWARHDRKGHGDDRISSATRYSVLSSRAGTAQQRGKGQGRGEWKVDQPKQNNAIIIIASSGVDRQQAAATRSAIETDIISPRIELFHHPYPSTATYPCTSSLVSRFIRIVSRSFSTFTTLVYSAYNPFVYYSSDRHYHALHLHTSQRSTFSPGHSTLPYTIQRHEI